MTFSHVEILLRAVSKIRANCGREINDTTMKVVSNL